LDEELVKLLPDHDPYAKDSLPVHTEERTYEKDELVLYRGVIWEVKQKTSFSWVGNERYWTRRKILQSLLRGLTTMNILSQNFWDVADYELRLRKQGSMDVLYMRAAPSSSTRLNKSHLRKLQWFNQFLSFESVWGVSID
jgi:hypothetical protein